MPQDLDIGCFVVIGADGARRLDLALDGVTCAACISDIEQGMTALREGLRARLNYSNRRLSLSWDGEDFDPRAATERLRVMGYRAHPFELADVESRDHAATRDLYRRLGVAGFAAMNVMLLSVSVWAGNASDIGVETRDMFHWLSALIAIPAAAYSAQPFFASARAALGARRLNMDVPISLGVLLALGMSVVETALHSHHAFFDSALMLIFFLLLGRTMEQAMRRRTRAVAGNLAAMRAVVAQKIEADGTERQVPAARLSVGDVILVRPGERIPIDAIVLSGASTVDESIVTGETRARAVAVGEALAAGVMNLNGVLRLRVARTAEHSFLAEVETLLERAASTRAGFVGLAERASRIYAPVVHVTALATAAGWLAIGASWHDAIVIAIAVLIITCPCALALAVPAVHVAASGALFREGVLLNGGEAIERLAGADTIVFDKTGTLTLPEPRAVNCADYPADLVAAAARLAHASRHPLARALAYSAPHAQACEDAKESAGQGVSAVIDGLEARLGAPSFCGVSPAAPSGPDESQIAFQWGERSALFAIRQSLRLDAADVIAALRAKGYAIEILSGDHETAVRAVADALGVTAWRAGARPADKVARLDALKAEGRKVLMVGDGLNDAPALAAAHVSLSPVAASELAQASADAIFLGEALSPVVAALAIARKARALMRDNLAIAIVYNAIAVPVAVAGHVTPLIAALAMSGSSLLVTANALRADGGRKAKPQPEPSSPLQSAGAPA